MSTKLSLNPYNHILGINPNPVKLGAFFVYTLTIPLFSTKVQLKEAISTIFGVTAAKINTKTVKKPYNIRDSKRRTLTCMRIRKKSMVYLTNQLDLDNFLFNFGSLKTLDEDGKSDIS